MGVILLFNTALAYHRHGERVSYLRRALGLYENLMPAYDPSTMRQDDPLGVLFMAAISCSAHLDMVSPT